MRENKCRLFLEDDALLLGAQGMPLSAEENVTPVWG